MKPVDPTLLSTDRFLKNIQGNTLKGHGRDYTTHIFVRFRVNRGKTTKEWIRTFAENHLTSIKKQLEEREAFKKDKKPGNLFASFFLTSSGYEVLGFNDVHKRFKDEAFLKGMKLRKGELNDPDSRRWESGFRTRIDAMILLADDDKNRMGEFAKELIDTLSTFCSVCGVEYGNAIRNSAEKGIEHFGYVDGTSQPLFLKEEIDEYYKLHNIDISDPKSAPDFDPSADTDLILIPDPYAEQNDSKPALGSYFVFRKLEQNVRQFKKAEEIVGEDLFPDLGQESKRELAGAYLVGRFEDGTPVMLDDEDSIPNSAEYNNFNYSKDLSEGRCPHFAHIRKVNPRTSKSSEKMMARRGIPFGMRSVDTELEPIMQQMPEAGVGLLFMSYQASIVEQFEHVQKKFSNDPSFPEKNTGIDPIIGQSVGSHMDRTYQFPKTYGTASPSIKASFRQFVHMKGGEYFFAPSLTFLKTVV
ncbi:Dyp-type peroxidase [Dyadobacter sp. CY323]|uniref:Dyp-type peroxidase n=1 Tax=Dyadobacter sp. CY323 TaxID=2907302 RepID=UPI001F2113C6|nr:Dyp-type peroxidase [Dyadobacter sp. CY323]MCE6989805.1 Dyp-type peroxidase [Dyadobacter sp. CY323]